MEPVACRNLDDQEWKARGAVRGYAMDEIKTPLAIDNIQTYPRTQAPEFFRKHGLVSCLRVPLIAKDTLIGLFSFYTKEEREFSNEESKFLVMLAGQAAIAIYNSQLYADAQRREAEVQQNHEHAQALYAVTTAANQSLDLTMVLNEVIRKVTEIFNFNATRIFLFDPQMESLLLRASYETSPDAFISRGRFRRSQGVVGTVAERGEPVIFEDTLSDPRYQKMSPWGGIKKAGLRFFAAFPIKSKLQTIGVIYFLQYNPRSISPSEIELLTAMMRQIGIAVENAHLFEDTSKKADELSLKTLELERANKAKDEFLSVMSHELRTPLNVVLGYAAIIRDGMLGEINLEQQKALEKVIKSTGDQVTMITSILQTTQADAGRLKLDLEEVGLSVFLDDLKSNYQVHSGQELNLNWDYASELPVVKTDGMKLKQILQNLIDNAIKFTQKGTVTISAQVQEQAIGKRPQPAEDSPHASRLMPHAFIKFKVADTGTGIPKEHLPIIFDKFRQIDSSETRLYGGVGLGLYIVKRFTEMLGGDVRVESEVGRGSTFTLSLPC